MYIYIYIYIHAIIYTHDICIYIHIHMTYMCKKIYVYTHTCKDRNVVNHIGYDSYLLGCCEKYNYPSYPTTPKLYFQTNRFNKAGAHR